MRDCEKWKARSLKMSTGGKIAVLINILKFPTNPRGFLSLKGSTATQNEVHCT